MTAPVGAVGGPVGRVNLDQKTAVGRGAWAEDMALALSEGKLTAHARVPAVAPQTNSSSSPTVQRKTPRQERTYACVAFTQPKLLPSVHLAKLCWERSSMPQPVMAVVLKPPAAL